MRPIFLAFALLLFVATVHAVEISDQLHCHVDVISQEHAVSADNYVLNTDDFRYEDGSLPYRFTRNSFYEFADSGIEGRVRVVADVCGYLGFCRNEGNLLLTVSHEMRGRRGGYQKVAEAAIRTPFVQGGKSFTLRLVSGHGALDSFTMICEMK